MDPSWFGPQHINDDSVRFRANADRSETLKTLALFRGDDKKKDNKLKSESKTNISANPENNFQEDHNTISDLVINDKMLKDDSEVKAFNTVNTNDVGIEDDDTMKRFSWTEDFKSITLDLGKADYEGIIDAFMCLVGLLRKNGANLESLTLCDSSNLIDGSDAPHKAIDHLIKELSRLDSLRSLKIENVNQKIISWENAIQMLQSAKNLRQFHFYSRSTEKPAMMEFLLPFEEMSQLVELKIRLPPRLTFDSVEHIVDNINRLENLEVLEIMEGSFEDMIYELLIYLIKALSWLNNLREVVISTGLRFDQGKETMVNGIRDEVKSLFDANSRLEKIVVYQGEEYEVKYVR